MLKLQKPVLPLPTMYANITKDITLCQRLLQKGELVSVPTETVYGLGANIYDDIAIRKIFALKGRPFFNPLIVHIHHLDQLSTLTKTIPETARRLAGEFWPGPLTLILPKRPEISDLITAGKPTVAVRIPAHPMTLELLQKLDFPIAAPSANPFTCISPTTAQHVADYFGDRIPAILDGGACTVGLESTIIGFEGPTPIVYRKGGISIEAIEALVGGVRLVTENEEAPQAPGMLLKHYAPRTKVVLNDTPQNALQAFEGHKVGILSFTKKHFPGAIHVETLSQTGNLEEAAQKLFAALHRLDEARLDVIIAERFPEKGLGISINDRLERAEN
ncbi:MAG: L-threonylcarbamoyladenylate synthase [Bacteroidota bacterium]